MSLDSTVEAVYEDGLVVREIDHDDVSQFVEGKNTFHDILEKYHEAAHGNIVRFSVHWKGKRYDVNWVGLPDNARPIRFRQGNLETNVETGAQKFWWSGVDFGYQYVDKTGKSQKEVMELR
jgi:hypothetical protein